ncbi:DUF445 family protein [Desulfolithobacter sp.]
MITPSLDPALLAWAGPPVLGAFIGYLTNKVAIKMLFRPLKPWRICGIRVPMTPGVIPSKRHELAVNIGEMVGQHLLTSKDIGEALSREQFQDHLYRIVDDMVRDVLSRDLGPAASVVPRRFRAYFKIGIRTLKYQLKSGVHGFFQSEDFARSLEEILFRQLDRVGKRSVNEFLAYDERQAVYRFIEDFVAELLTGEEVEKWFAAYLREQVENAAREDRSIGDHLPESLTILIVSTIREQAPRLLEQLARMLAEPTMREKIICGIRDAINGFLSTLGPLAAMASSFLDAGSLEKKIRQYLEDKEENIATWLKQPAVQDRFADVLGQQAEKFLATPISSLLDKVDGEQLDRIFQETAHQLLAVLRTEGVRRTFASLLHDSMESMLDEGRRPLAEVVGRLLGPETTVSLQQTIVRESITLVRSRQVKTIIDSMLGTMIDQLIARPIGVLRDLMPAGVRRGITEYLVQQINRLLQSQVPGLVDSLNIRRIVTEKVDSLDLLRLEGLLLSIMEEQFKYINLFGALLGFLIGMANLLILRLG